MKSPSTLPSFENHFTLASEAISDSDIRLRELGYAPQFKRDMSFLGVIGISFWY